MMVQEKTVHLVRNVNDIDEGENKDRLLKLLADKDTKLIFESINNSPKSTIQLSHECKIPASTVYRKIRKLYNYNFVKRTYTLNNSKKSLLLYKHDDAVVK